MPGDDDAPWEDEFAATDENEKTALDMVEAIPEAAPSRDSTGKHTLPGFADAVERTREHYLAQGRIYEARRIFAALKLIRIGAGDHPTAADDIVKKFKKWMIENDELIREAMKG